MAISDYELARDARIKRNKQRLQELNLPAVNYSLPQACSRARRSLKLHQASNGDEQARKAYSSLRNLTLITPAAF